MPNPTPEIPLLTTINTALSQINIAIPLAAFAITSLYQLLRKDNPEMTPADYIEYLRTQGQTVSQFSVEWLAAHGYVRDAEGHWRRI